ncbi:dihydroxyacetone kinase subunit DhaL [Bacillus sp. T33-2]|uniref:dihydroxyacetone kinase subunit DhaL n=1 Tax=Bacillus sp. T33-2 TaxID=2054168 RepID=UPI000C7866F2|nr:dihydroxyacetone kinase subunit DhaL [Bacillus sp. T33-2]PLR96766.1 dihydroxyacetone kinase subunit L [Bacillus sp. T33-2]
MGFGVEEAKLWLKQLNDIYQQQKIYLTELDQAIGDGDHGINMARGFNEVAKKIDNAVYSDLGALFKDTGMTLLSKVGGASGPLYGTVFLKAAASLKEKQQASAAELTEAFAESLEGIKMRGKAGFHDKTMLDVWIPVVDFLKSHGDHVDWDGLMKLSIAKMEETKNMEAKKGRASYLGPRSVGHIDPGAASSHFFFTELAKVFKGAEL